MYMRIRHAYIVFPRETTSLKIKTIRARLFLHYLYGMKNMNQFPFICVKFSLIKLNNN